MAAGLLAALAARSVAAVPVEVSLRLSTQPASGQTLRAKVMLKPADHRPEAAPIVREAALAERVAFEVEPGSAWEVSIEAVGYWSRPEPVFVGAEGASVMLEMLPAGEVRGTVQVPRGTELPRELTIRFRSAPGAEPALPPGSQACPVAEGRFRCELPAGRLDLRLRARGHVTQYRWGAVIPARGALDVGSLELQPGASVVGWVEPPDDKVRFEEVTLELAPQAATGLFSPDEAERRTALATTGKPNDRGFFEFSGVAPGSYVLLARHARFAPTRMSPVRVEPGAETEIHHVVLEPPATLEVRFDPPRDPWDRVWQVGLLRRGEVAEHPTPVTSTVASPEGLFRADGLEPGRYLVQVETGRWGRWHQEEIEVAPGMASHEVRLPVTKVEGEVTLGGEPLVAAVWWGGRSGAIRVPVKTGEDGRFKIVLPKRETWRVEVVSPPLDLVHTVPILELDLDDEPVRVAIDVPDLSLRGEVVEESGRPVSKALITADGPPGHFLQVDGDDDGRFEIRGAVPGEWRVAAEGGRGLVADTVTVQLREGIPLEEIRLVAKQPRELSGLVVGPDGQGVSGALVVGRLEPHQRPLELIVEQQWTKVEGQFTLRLPPRAGTVLLTVFAPGFAVTQVRASPSKEPVVIPVRRVGGTLVLEYDRSLDDVVKRWAIKLFGEFELGHRPTVDSWLRLHGQDPEAPEPPGLLVVPMLAPGTYTACLDPAVLAELAGRPVPPSAPPRCVSGDLAPGGELVLKVPAPPA